MTVHPILLPRAIMSPSGLNMTFRLPCVELADGALQTTASRANGQSTPTTATRALAAYTDIIDPATDIVTMKSVGVNTMRFCRRKDGSGSYLGGFLREAAGKNLCLQSADFATTWAKLDAGDTVTTNSLATPDGTTTADSLIADSTDGDHGVTQDITLTGVDHIFSVYAKKGNKDWLYIENSTVAACSCYFNIASAAVGTSGAGATGGVDDLGNGWVRCWILFTGTVAPHTFNIQTADADTDKTVTGDGSTVNTYLWGAQCELEPLDSRPSSYIPTTTAQVTRGKDILRYEANDNIGGADAGICAVECKVLARAAPSALTGVIQISDGFSAAKEMILYAAAGNGRATILADTGGVISSTTNVCNNTVNGVAMEWQTNELNLYVNGVSKGQDTSITPVDGLDAIEVAARSGNSEFVGIISDIRIYGEFVGDGAKLYHP